MSDHPSVIGLIGGSGLEKLDIIENVREVPVPDTPYGKPSDAITLGTLGGYDVAFVARHGREHHLAPCQISYKANLWALRSLGVRTVVATCIAGSLKQVIKPGHFVVPDQFVNRTWGRDRDSIEADGSFLHLPMADPYCARLAQNCIAALRYKGADVHAEGTIVVIQGPRFSTKAESRALIREGFDLVNMTQYPECLFARELGLCYAVMASITDWDVGTGLTHSMTPTGMEDVLRIFRTNTEVMKGVLTPLVQSLQHFSCGCALRAGLTEEYYKR